jgi:hypothetical protein
VAAYRYPEEKFREAARVLATSSSTLQDRLHSAALAIHALAADDFEDPTLRARFTALEDMLTWKNAEDEEGTFRATTAGLSDDQAERAAEAIFEIYAGLTLRG